MALDGEVDELFPRLLLSPSQLLPELQSLSFHLVSGGRQVLLHQLVLFLSGVQPVPQLDDKILTEEGNKMEAAIRNQTNITSC